MSELFGIKKVGPNRYREDPGRYFEDFNIGDIYEHWPGRTITETDNICLLYTSPSPRDRG